MPASPEPKAKVTLLTRSVRTPRQQAMLQFCFTARTCKPILDLLRSEPICKFLRRLTAMESAATAAGAGCLKAWNQSGNRLTDMHAFLLLPCLGRGALYFSESLGGNRTDLTVV